MNDSSIFLKNIVICHNCDRLQSMLNEPNKILLTKKRITDELNAKIIEFGSKVKEDDSVIKEPKSQINYEIHLDEMRLLNIKLQNLETKNQALRSTSGLRCSTMLDLEKIYIDQKVHDKMRLEYVESLPSTVSKDTESPKENRGQS
jgi:hypothetical protein